MGKTERIIIIVVAAILACIIGVAIYMTVDKSLEQDKNFDYTTSNMSNYVSLPEKKYKGQTVEIDIAKPRDIDADIVILNILASHKGEVLNNGAAVTSPVVIATGDVADIWYRGYVLDENGDRNYLPGMCNFSNSEPWSFEVGTYDANNSNVPRGLGVGLVGKNTGDYSRFEKITKGTVKSGQVAYVSYTRLIEGGDQKTDATTGAAVRIDLSDKTIDDTYGKGFAEKILGADIGEVFEFDVTIDGKKYTYSNASVDVVTECEVEPIIVKCYYPYDYYSEAYKNRDAWFEIYVDKVQQYESRELNDEFVLELINANGSEISLDKLNEYEGDTLSDKFRASIEAALYEEYEAEYETLVAEEMWDLCLAEAEIKRYPGKMVDEIYAEYEQDVYYQYEQTGGSLKNSYTEEYEYFEDVDSFAEAYLSGSYAGYTYSGYDDWKEYLYEMSKVLVKDRLVLFYLLDKEGLMPTDEELEVERAILFEDYLDLYVELYFEQEGVSRSDFTDEEYEEFLEEGKENLKKIPEEEIVENLYTNILMRELVKWAKVLTLDDK